LFLVVLAYGAWPAIRAYGLGFLFDMEWNPNPEHERYGALVFVYGTLVSSFAALAVAAPVGIAAAAFISEALYPKLRGTVALVIDILATVPSVVYGLWGIFVLAPWVRMSLQPFLAKTLGFLPLFQGAHRGLGMLCAILVLSIMLLPIIVSISLDSMRAVPATYREAALALGATRMETIMMAVLAPARSGLVGACILALGRALGETMAVTMVIGNAHRISVSLFAPANTIASTIANEFSEATTDLYSASLIYLALLLFLLTLMVNLAARLLVRRLWSGAKENTHA
jgi:phosphate transport system permease protein